MIPFFDQRVFQAIRVVDKVKAKAALDAQMAEIGRRVIHPGDPNDSIINLFQIQLAPYPAVGTGGFGSF